MSLRLRAAVAVAFVVGLVGAAPALADHGFPHSAGDPGRGFELVSPADKPSGIGVGVTYTNPVSMGPSGSGAYVGDRFAVEGNYGSMLIDGPFAFANDYAFADRTGDLVGWVSHPPVTHPLKSRQFTRFFRPGVATPDFSRTVWQSNGPAPLFEQMVGWSGTAYEGVRYLADWEGRWELLNMTDSPAVQAPEGNPFGGHVDVTESALSVDGRVAVSSGWAHGLLGPRDPAVIAPGGERLAGGSVYRMDAAGPLTDAFPAADVASRYTLVNLCAGSGADRTEIPERTAGDELIDAQPCPAASPDRVERLVSPYGASAMSAIHGNKRLVQRNALSADGRRVFFMAPDPVVGGSGNPGAAACNADVGAGSKCPAQLYVRQSNLGGGDVVRWVSRPVDGLLGVQEASLLGPAVFEGASTDGGRVLFRTTSPLTADDPNGGGLPVPAGGVVTGSASASSWDLYLYDLANGADPTDGGELTRVSGGPDGEGDCNNPQGGLGSGNPIGSQRAATLRFASEDATRIVFACSAPLPGAVVPADDPGDPLRRVTTPDGTQATTAHTNLYLYDAGLPPAQRWRFIARIPRAVVTALIPALADMAPACASTGAPAGPLVSMASGGGSDLGSGRANGCVSGTADGGFITFWTSGRLTADDPDETSLDLYGYDVDADRLVRLTRPADGAVGGSYQCLEGEALQCHGDPAYFYTGGANSPLGVATHPDVLGDRVAFFQSRSRLVAGDQDDAYDVYQWRNGELSLISTGDSAANDGAIYRGNDRSGRNVYFATRDALTWQDADSVADVYVARAGSEGIPVPAVPAVCAILADSCRAATVVSPLPAAAVSDRPGGGDATRPVMRPRLGVGVSLAARRRVARTGVLAVRVRTRTAGLVRVVVRGRVGGRVRVVGRGRGRARVRRAGTVAVRVRLARPALRRLRRTGRLAVAVAAAQRGMRPRQTRIRLRTPTATRRAGR